MVKNTLPNKSGNPESLRKWLHRLWSSPTNVCIVCEDMLSEFCKGPSIKHVHSNGEGGVQVKAYIFCFYNVILLFKSALEGEGVSEKSPNLSVHTLWIVAKMFYLGFCISSDQWKTLCSRVFINSLRGIFI